MRSKVVISFIPITVLLICLSSANAEVPGHVNYQGYLTDLDGIPIGIDPPAQVEMWFSIYNQETGGTEMWTEDPVTVTVDRGVFNVILGKTNPITPDLIDGPCWLEVIVDGGGGGEYLVPREQIVSTLFSIKAQDADTIDGIEAAELEESQEIIDHASEPSAHHDPYTDAEAVVACDTAGMEESEEIDVDVASHAGIADAHHTKTTSFAEMSDVATDVQIPDDITINFALTAGDADTVDGHEGHAPYTDAMAVLAGQEEFVTSVGDTITGDLNILGDVGIGTTEPAVEFDVNGRISANGYHSSYNGTGHTLPSETPTSWYFGSVNYDLSGHYPEAYGNLFGHAGPSDGYGYSFQLFKGAGASDKLFIRFAQDSLWQDWRRILDSYDDLKTDGVLEVDSTEDSYILGNVGIGTTEPSTLLEIGDDFGVVGKGQVFVNGQNSYNDGYYIDRTLADEYAGFNMWNGWATILARGDTSEHGRFRFRSTDDGTNFVDRFVIYEDGNVGIGTTDPQTLLHVAGDARIDGNIAAKYQDIAEWVESHQKLEPGTVVAIDTKNTNRVVPSTFAYDTSIAGVVSKEPGLLLGEAGNGKYMISHSGRVKTKVSATFGEIEPGDLLVASPIPGVAMKSEPVNFDGVEMHRPGTILGKALEAHYKGEGKVLVLLSLQ